jgi:uncharacterized membrane protein
LIGPLEESQSRPEGDQGGLTLVPVTETDDPEVEVEAFATSRVIFFSDAVLAIAITLLALGLPLPRTTGSTTNLQMAKALADNWDSYLAFVVSFAVIGNHWAAHRRVFRYVTRVNYRVGLLTLLWLLMMVLTPFAAKLLAGSGGFGVRFTLYALIQIVAWVCLVLMSRVVVHDDLLRPDAPETARHPDNVISFTVIAMFALAIPVAFFTAAAFALWAAIPVLIRAERWRRAGGTPRQLLTRIGLTLRIPGQGKPGRTDRT